MTSNSQSWSRLPARQLDCAPEDLNLEHTLDCGQTFRWRRDATGAWIGVVGQRVFRLSQTPLEIAYQACPDDSGAIEELAGYLRLDVELRRVQNELCRRDPEISKAFSAFGGLRVLTQPAEETLFTFVCSPASNITRITRSVDELARRYGQSIATVDDRAYYAFPSSGVIGRVSAEELTRAAGLGFRGRNLRSVAFELNGRPEGWAASLCCLPYDLARARLMELPSVGPKIADCVALFGLRHDAAVPVDTHVWGLARELFGARFQGRSLTPSVCEEVRSAFLGAYGPYAGWAQQYLYHARRVARSLPMPSGVRLGMRPPDADHPADRSIASDA